MKKQYTCLGMMSGTSGDGVDASIILSDGENQFKLLEEKYYEYDNDLFDEYHKLKKKINTSKDLNYYSTSIKSIENKITIFHAKVFKDISSKIKLDLVGFHGQTIYHNPKEKISLQLGNGNLLSQLIKKKLFLTLEKTIYQTGEKALLLLQFFINLF